MVHAEAVENLLAYADGSLAPELRGALAAHTETCSGCAEWLETYAILSQGLALAGGHPGSALLARHVARPHDLADAEAAFVEDHLDGCPDCSEDLAVLRSALRETAWTAPTASRRSRDPGSYWMRHRRELVAAVLLVAVTVGFLVSFGLYRSESEVRAGAARLVQVGAATAPDATELFGMDLEGNRVIESRSDLRISDSRVKDGARVRIRAGGGVAFGDGFRVESGASLAVEGGPSLDRGKEPI